MKETEQIPTTPLSASSTKSEDQFAATVLTKSNEIEGINDYSENLIFLIEKKIEEEIDKFSMTVSNHSYMRSIRISKKFWSAHNFPYLKKLFGILLNIPSSGAFIERFFSICGSICSVRRGRSDTDLIRCRCLLKANFKLLQELKFEEY